MDTPRNVHVFVGTKEIEPSESSPLGEDAWLIPKPAVTIKLADGTWLEFMNFANVKSAHKGDKTKSNSSLSHRAAVGPGGVLQVIIRTNTVWEGDTNTDIDPETHAKVVVVQKTFHDILRTFAPAAWREVEGNLGEWIPENYEERPKTRPLPKKNGQ